MVVDMEEIYITERELEYLTNVPNEVCEKTVSYKSQMNFEKAVKECNGITLEQFSKNIDKAIRRLIPNP